MLTGTRPTIDPRILGSAMGDLFPEDQRCQLIKKESIVLP
jgi:hypothetical protein